MVDLIKTSWEAQSRVEEWARQRRRSGWLGRVREIFKLSRKPSMEEFTRTCQITGVGLFLLGALGFLIYLLWTSAFGTG